MSAKGPADVLKLDACGGSFPLGEGYVNVDARLLPEVDVVADLVKGLPFRDGAFAEVASCGTLEHFGLEELPDVLKEMFRVLREGGRIVIGVPDLRALMDAYLAQEIDFPLLSQYLYGRQAHPLDIHRVTLDSPTLTRLLKEAGFSGYRRVAYSFPFHIPRYMLQVEAHKGLRGTDVKDQEERAVVNDIDEAHLPFTGERLVPNRRELQDLYVKHMARYVFAGRHVAGRQVLDAGCGCGYGTYFLAAGGAREVCGVDLSQAAVRFAAGSYSRPNLSYMVADVIRLPFAEARFDTVVSFELIEHIEEPEALLREALRVLRPGGLFLVSTPNRVKWEGKPANPYHFREFSLKEFREVLAGHFLVLDVVGEDISAAHQAARENEIRLHTFLQTMINYEQQYRDYRDRQLASLRDHTQQAVTALRDGVGRELGKVDARLGDWDSLFRAMVRQMPAVMVRSMALAIPERLKRLVPARFREKVAQRLEAKALGFGRRWAGAYLAQWQEEAGLKGTPSHGQRAGRLGVPVPLEISYPSAPAKQPVRPPLQKVPLQLADIEIRPEFVEESLYFIAVCEKPR